MIHNLVTGCLAACVAFAAHAQTPAASDNVAVNLWSGAPIRLQQFTHEEAAIELDGLLNEEAWATVPAFDRMRLIEPDTLEEPIYRSDVRLLYSERGLYVSFDLEQPAETIVQRFSVRDDFATNRELVSFVLDTSGDGRYGYFMGLALGDNQLDGTILPERQFSFDWDGAWYGATHRTDTGWSAEFFIPWSQMAMPKEDGTRRIGLYAVRKVAHINEEWGWPALPVSQPRFISQFQQLRLDGVDPRQQWSIFPYVSSTLDAVDDRSRYKAGIDVFWRPSTNFQLTATVNPDFGSVESDDVDVNLTANETFFPEKRLFFQEGREIFNITAGGSGFGNTNRFVIVNTRRIAGRPRDLELPPGFELSDRQQLRRADLLAAGKVTGQIGAVRYGVLAAAEDETIYNVDGSRFSQDGSNFGAFRVLYEDSIGATYRGLGFISTFVSHPESDALVNGIDAHYLTTDGRWRFDAQLVHSDIDEDGSGIGVLGDIAYQRRQGMKHSLQLTYFDDTVDVNDFGFQQRNNISEARYRIEITKSSLTRVRDLRMTPFVRYQVNGDGFRTGTSIGTGININLNNLDRINSSITWSAERFDDRNSFGNGTFRVDARPDLNVTYRTNTARELSFFARIAYQGEDTGGFTTNPEVGIVWQPIHNLKMEAKASFSDRNGWLLHQEDGNFTEFNAAVWQPELRLEFFPTAMQQFQIALQWIGIRAEEDRFYVLPDGSNDLVEVANPNPPGETDDFSISRLNFQVRYRWQIAPLSDLFIVYTKGDSRRTDLTGFTDMFRDSWQDPLGEQLVIKFRYRLGS